jgi:DNA-directed RNA polymerase specialized sigma24 family protein
MLRLAIKAEFSTLLEAKNTNKERVNHYTVDDLVRERKRDFSDELIELTDYDSNPEDIVIASWGKEQAYERFKELCSELEWEVFQMWMFDQHHWGAYREIAERLGITEKAVDNAMIRIRRKAEKVAEEAENGTL